jgi:hypothetical protein
MNYKPHAMPSHGSILTGEKETGQLTTPVEVFRFFYLPNYSIEITCHLPTPPPPRK